MSCENFGLFKACPTRFFSRVQLSAGLSVKSFIVSWGVAFLNRLAVTFSHTRFLDKVERMSDKPDSGINQVPLVSVLV